MMFVTVNVLISVIIVAKWVFKKRTFNNQNYNHNHNHNQNHEILYVILITITSP